MKFAPGLCQHESIPVLMKRIYERIMKEGSTLLYNVAGYALSVRDSKKIISPRENEPDPH